jgi:hypothetical protein
MSNDLDLIADQAANQSTRLRKNRALWIAFSCIALSTASMWAHQSALLHDKADGIFEAQSSIGDVRKAMGLWNPNDGYAQLAGQSYETTLRWGATQLIEPLPGIGGERGIVLEILFANKSQCQGILEATEGFFDHTFVDLKSIKSVAEPCTHLGQNALRMVKIDPRPLSLEIEARRQNPKLARMATQPDLSSSSTHGTPTPLQPGNPAN